MSFEGHPFRWVPSLEHMAEVKIIEALCRTGELRKKFEEILPEVDSSSFSRSSKTITGHIQDKVDDLQIPWILKTNLENPMKGMLIKAIEWLHSTRMDSLDLTDDYEYRAQAMRYFFGNLCFNNFGCVDGRKTLESYVKDKEIVGYWVWHQLCLYCIEDKIVKLFAKFDWQECSDCLNSQCAAYWYRKISGKLPSNKMLTKNLQDAKEDLFGAFSNGENIVKSMLEALITDYREGRSVAAIIHFQNQLNNDEEFNRLVSDSFPEVLIPPSIVDIFIYLLRTKPKNAALELSSNYADILFIGLTRWPWIFLINDWKYFFETNVDANFFISFFHHMGKAIPKMKGQFQLLLYREFERTVGIFHERFISNSEVIAKAFWTIFFKNDAAHMCTLMLEGVGSDQRKLVIEAMSEHVRIEDRGETLYHFNTREKLSSFREIVNRVFSGEESQYFWDTYDNYHLRTRRY